MTIFCGKKRRKWGEDQLVGIAKMKLLGAVAGYFGLLHMMSKKS